MAHRYPSHQTGIGGGNLLGIRARQLELLLSLAVTACSGEISAPATTAASDKSSDEAEATPKATTPKSIVNKSKDSTDTSTDIGSDPGTVVSGTDTSVSTVTYPEMMLKGRGTTLCDGNTYDTLATAKSRLSDSQFVMQLAAATVHTNRFEDRVQEELNNNLSEVQYTLVPVSERGKVDGKDLAIFATSSLQVKKKMRWNFSSPLPVYVWPAPPSRFDSLRTGGPKTWTATVSGSKQFDVEITLTHVRTTGNRTTILLETRIPKDRRGELYEDFPVPKVSEITVDGDRQIVERSKNENHFYGEKNCDGTLGIVKLEYELCTRTVDGKVEDLGCSR